NISITFGILAQFVWDRASNINPDDRKLELAQLKTILLATINEDEKWYWDVLDQWKTLKPIQVFNIGEFYQVIDATRHCRHQSRLSSHDAIWIAILQSYINFGTIAPDFKRKAIYEYLWLRLRPLSAFDTPKGDLLGEAS